MPEPDGEPASQVPLPPGRFGDPDAPPQTEQIDVPDGPAAIDRPPQEDPPQQPPVVRRSGPGALARLISVIVSVGLAWALFVAVTAWVLGVFLTRG